MYLESKAKDYHKTRTAWYMDAIIDFMLANPGAKMKEVAAHVKRAPVTISAIVNSMGERKTSISQVSLPCGTV